MQSFMKISSELLLDDRIMKVVMFVWNLSGLGLAKLLSCPLVKNSCRSTIITPFENVMNKDISVA